MTIQTCLIPITIAVVCAMTLSTEVRDLQSLTTHHSLLTTHQEADKLITNSIDMKLTLIPAGKFLMGSSAAEAERDLEEVQHEVEITKPFYLGVYEVTQGQYEKIMSKQTAHFRQGEDFP